MDCSPCKLGKAGGVGGGGSICKNAGASSLLLKVPSSKNTKKIAYDLTENDDYDREEIPTYEEVAKLYPRSGFHRPVVLIGPPGVGRNELKRRLIDLDPSKYKTTIPCESFSCSTMLMIAYGVAVMGFKLIFF